ncbi:permease PerM [Salmonella enterica subsp. arizonae]|nr:permease PerM [Salmonella enterica subsp. arizonae]
MLEMLMQWYRRRFSDPEAIALLVILVAGFSILFFFSGLLAPLLVAIVLAYLLEWPTARLQAIGCSGAGQPPLSLSSLSAFCY